jgi:hypothetical protein
MKFPCDITIANFLLYIKRFPGIRESFSARLHHQGCTAFPNATCFCPDLFSVAVTYGVIHEKYRYPLFNKPTARIFKHQLNTRYEILLVYYEH